MSREKYTYVYWHEKEGNYPEAGDHGLWVFGECTLDEAVDEFVREAKFYGILDNWSNVKSSVEPEYRPGVVCVKFTQRAHGVHPGRKVIAHFINLKEEEE